MLLGEECGRKSSITAARFEAAAKRVSSALAFVGLMEHWDLSICL